MKVNIVHPSLNRHGGAERVLLELIKSLSNAGHETNLYTLDRIRWDQLTHSFGSCTHPVKEFYTYDNLPGLDSPLNWCLIAIAYLRLLIQAKINGDGISINNYGEVFPFISDFSYIHSIPLFTKPKKNELNPYSVPFWTLLSRGYRIAHLFLRRRLSEVILTNSVYNSDIIERSLGIKPIIVSPPIHVQISRLQTVKKEAVVLSMSRFSKTKMLDNIPRIAHKTKSKCKFVVLGHLNTGSSQVLDTFQKLCQRLGVLDRVEVITNPCQKKIDEWLRKAQVYLSTQPTEAFGMAIAEAMSFGCVPIVPRSGGPWLDILKGEQGTFGFSYTSFNEAAHLIDHILSDEQLIRDVQLRAEERVKEFSSESFSKGFVGLIERYYYERIKIGRMRNLANASSYCKELSNSP